jgi:hypothetical protein
LQDLNCFVHAVAPICLVSLDAAAADGDKMRPTSYLLVIAAFVAVALIAYVIYRAAPEKRSQPSSVEESRWILRNPPHPDYYGLDQRLPLSSIRDGLSKVKTGMNQKEILDLLGNPGGVYHNGWTYYQLDDEGYKVLGSEQGQVDIAFDDVGKVSKVMDSRNGRGLMGVGK